MILALSRPDPRLAPLADSVERIELEPLSDAEMDELVAGTVDGAPEVLLAAIRAYGGGIPLYAVETLRELADRGVLAVEDSDYVVRGALGEVSVPPTIRALVSSRLGRLGQLERKVLAAGAVLGGDLHRRRWSRSPGSRSTEWRSRTQSLRSSARSTLPRRMPSR
jgi:predicted ATPase